VSSSSANNNLKNEKKAALIEQNVNWLFDLLTHCAESYKLDSSRTQFEQDMTLELSSAHSYIRFSYSAEAPLAETTNDIIAIVILEYTGQDLRPLKARPITERSFQGFLNKLYLIDEKWFLLNPRDYGAKIDQDEFLISEETIKNRILKELFEH
jgi:hypothetical protein